MSDEFDLPEGLNLEKFNATKSLVTFASEEVNQLLEVKNDEKILQVHKKIVETLNDDDATDADVWCAMAITIASMVQNYIGGFKENNPDASDEMASTIGITTFYMLSQHMWNCSAQSKNEKEESNE